MDGGRYWIKGWRSGDGPIRFRLGEVIAHADDRGTAYYRVESEGDEPGAYIVRFIAWRDEGEDDPDLGPAPSPIGRV